MILAQRNLQLAPLWSRLGDGSSVRSAHRTIADGGCIPDMSVVRNITQRLS